MYRSSMETPKTQGSIRAVALLKSVIADLDEWRALSRNTVLEPGAHRSRLVAHQAWWSNSKP